MFPQSGHGFIWEQVDVKPSDNLATATIFVPESKSLFNVSISTKDVDKKHLNVLEWIEWTSVGERDAAKPIPLQGTTIMDEKKDRCIVPQFTNQTKFRSVLLFPDRADLVSFVGEHNAWSPHVGIVICEETEVTRGAYCIGYIERLDNSTVSAFCANKDTMKFPDGYQSERDKTVFEGLAREIELAAEEARVMASKGRTPGGFLQIIPIPVKHDDGFDGFDQYEENPRATRRNVEKPGWKKNRSPQHIAWIQECSEFIKNNRFNTIIIYKHNARGRGFVGFTPKLGSVGVYAESHKNSDRRVRVGDTINTRIELNKHTEEFRVESIAEMEGHLVDFVLRESRKGPRRDELILHCKDLDMKDWKPINGRLNGKKYGVVFHPTLQKILVAEDDKKKWEGKKVRCDILHYEGIDKDMPDQIRLQLETVIGPFDDGSSSPMIVQIDGRPDDVESDYDDDDDEEEEKRVNTQSNEREEMDMRQRNGGPVSAFTRRDEYESGGGFESNSWTNQRGDDGGYGRRDRGGRGGGGRGYEGGDRDQGRGYERGGRDQGRGGGRYEGRGGRGGGEWDNDRQSSHASSSNPFLEEGHGFGTSMEKPSMHDEGFVIVYSKKDSYIYTKEHRVVKYEGDIQFNNDMNLGDSAKFGIEETNSPRVPFKVVRGTLYKTRDLFPNITKQIHQDELYIRVRGRLTANRDVFECEHVSDVRLGSSQSVLKLYNDDLVEKSRIKMDRPYDIFVRFCTDAWAWKFECLDSTSPSFELDEEDEIDRYKRLNKEKERLASRQSSRSPRSTEDEWESVPRSEVHSMRGGSTSNQRGNTHSSRGSDYHSCESRGGRDNKFSVPPSRQSSKAPSIMSTSTQLTTTTMTSEKEVKNLRRELENAKRLLKNVWSYKPVQKIVKQDNFFLYESVDDWHKEQVEDESERVY